MSVFLENSRIMYFFSFMVFRLSALGLVLLWYFLTVIMSLFRLGMYTTFMFTQMSATLIGYDVEQVLTTNVYSLLPVDRCQPQALDTTEISIGALVLYAPQIDIELHYCVFQASYLVSLLAHSSSQDDALFVSEKSRLIPTYYPINVEVCRDIWGLRNFRLPGFGDEYYKLTADDINIPTGSQKEFSYKAKFFRGGKNAGVDFVWPVSWINPLGTEIWGSIFIEAKLTVGKLVASLDKSSSPWSLAMKDPLGQEQLVSYPGSAFEHDSVSYLPKPYKECHMKQIYQFSSHNLGTIIRSGNVEYISGEVPNVEDHRVFYIELLNRTVSLCSYMVRATTYAGIYLVTERLHQELPLVDYNVDALPNLVFGTKIEFVHVNAHLSRERIVNFLKEEVCKTRHMILNGLISLASNLDNPNMFLGSGSMVGIHAEKAGAVLYVHKCAKIAVQVADFPYCTEEIPVYVNKGLNRSELRFMNPITQVIYPNHTLTACDPIAPYMYKTAEGLWMQYGSSVNPARTPDSLDIFTTFEFTQNLTSLHTAGLFSYENLKKSSQARILKYSRRTIPGREIYKTDGGHYDHPSLKHLDFNVKPELAALPEWEVLSGLSKVSKTTWQYAKDWTLSGLTAIAIFGFFIFLLKLFVACRLVAYGMPLAQALEPLNPLFAFRQHIALARSGQFRVSEKQPDQTPVVSQIYPALNATQS